ncbi:LOW QUALITY PROTEIN: hypothetical protein NC651_000009 [Populus alba x Populus x berolinensis]|nr:LOW QUALITY PROTEIN: hypothetical protein NC651_000009 [Populus alba x Populus x berolinensis]
MATAVLINGFHSRGNKMAKKQLVRGFMKYFSISILWDIFSIGFTLGKKDVDSHSSLLLAGKWLVSHLVNFSLLLGAVLSYGVMWPLIGQHKGDWFPASLDETSMKSFFSLAVALILGDGLYNFVKFEQSSNVHGRVRDKKLSAGKLEILYFYPLQLFHGLKLQLQCTLLANCISFPAAVDHQKKHHDYQRVNETFLRRDTIPLWVTVIGYVAFSILFRNCSANHIPSA